MLVDLFHLQNDFSNVLEFVNRLRCSDGSVVSAVGTTPFKGLGPGKVRQVSCSPLPVSELSKFTGHLADASRTSPKHDLVGRMVVKKTMKQNPELVDFRPFR